MGLDMYLYAKRYVSEYSSGDKELRSKLDELTALTGGFPIQEVKCEVMYWRKANAIHMWFVKNVQDGEDKCRPHWVSKSKLEKLILVCREVLADKSKAQELLPTSDGFFFGSTDFDEYYFEDLKNTADGIEKLLANEEISQHYDFEYQSSW